VVSEATTSSEVRAERRDGMMGTTGKNEEVAMVVRRGRCC
jgi:hypothetical protein